MCLLNFFFRQNDLFRTLNVCVTDDDQATLVGWTVAEAQVLIQSNQSAPLNGVF